MLWPVIGMFIDGALGAVIILMEPEREWAVLGAWVILASLVVLLSYTLAQILKYDNERMRLESLVDPRKVDEAIARGSLAPPK